MSGVQLGVIADDFTGAGDVSNILAQNGLTTRLFCSVPNRDIGAECDAVVIALRTRAAPVDRAVAQTLIAAEWLLTQGVKHLFSKICSTFDSTPEGNIGPVAEALAERTGEAAVIVCPAFPDTGRRVFQGHLFVDDRLLSDTGLAQHPLNPMTDPDLRRWLSRQTDWPVTLLPHQDVVQGDDVIGAALSGAMRHMVVADAVDEADLLPLGRAAAQRRVSVGASGLALGLARTLARNRPVQAAWRGLEGPVAALAGSCSPTSRAQIARHLQDHRGWQIAPADVLNGRVHPETVAREVSAAKGIPLVHSAAPPDEVAKVQAEFGAARVAQALDDFFAETARALVTRGVRRLIVAGGETSGAVVAGLALEALDIGPQIAPGVPAMRAADRDLVLTLKSGNFGGPGFFADAAEVLLHG